MDLDNTPINIGSSLRGKEESLIASELAERYGKTAELKMIEVMLLRTKVHYCAGV